MSEVIVDARLNHVVDGDTVNVAIEGDSRNRGVRILALDTEEVSASGGKPETRLGHEASRRARELLAGATSIRLAIPGLADFDPASTGHLDAFGRVLAYLETPDGSDFQEIMIAEGLSPYFQKYGYAADPERHAKYMAAERAAQRAGLGIWDQLGNNGAVMRDYGTLGVWWDLRARLVEVFRAERGKARSTPLLDARMDYDQILDRAEAGKTATLFIEYGSARPTGGPHHLLVGRSGDIRPLDTVIRNTHRPDGAAALTLARTRYMSEGGSQRRSYMYVTAPLQMYRRGRQAVPELVVTEPEQITDDPPA
ncbi:MAG: thermonuclease family protein [Alkalilacustris sp.]